MHFFKRKGNRAAGSGMIPLLQILGIVIVGVVLVYFAVFATPFPMKYNAAAADAASTTPPAPPVPQLDKHAYDLKLLELAHISTTTIASLVASSTDPRGGIPFSTASTTLGLWPVKTTYPDAGAILPFERVVAYYGNFYSKQMGVLGEYPPETMLKMLRAEVANWEAADPSTPVIPAIDYIAVTAQGSPGKDGMYRLRMPDDQIQKAIDLAAQVHGIVILDVQVGLSTLQSELPALEPFLKLPQVHLAIDPEFSMKTGVKPGVVIGTMDASDINYAAQFLAKLVKENNLPPKILVVHRFTEEMVTHYKQIQPLPEVQIVMDMDGWGFPAKKINTYTQVVYKEPVQFTGFKLFYKNDIKPPSTRMLTPAEILKLTPAPSFIQYQ